MKFLLTIAAIVGFFIILGFLITADEWRIAAIAGVVEAILTGTIYQVIKHFFPDPNKQKG